MTDETRDALLLAVAQWLIDSFIDEHDDRGDAVRDILARARHEIERPEDRG